MNARCWFILVMLFLSTSINYVDRMALSVLAPQLRADLGISGTQYGMITTVFMAAYMIGQLAGGVWVDRIGVRAGLALSIVVWSLAAMGHAAVAGVLGFVLLRFVLGLGEAANWPAATKAISQWMPKDRRAFAMGFFDSGSVLGGIVAPPLVAGIASLWGWRFAFVFTGLLGFVWLAAWLGMTREPGQSPTGKERPSECRRVRMFALLHWRETWGLMATRAIASPVWWFYVFWLPDYLHNHRGFSTAEIGALGWIPFLAAGAGTLTGGTLSDTILRWNCGTVMARKLVMIGAALCMLAGTRVVAAATGGESLAWVSLATFGFGMWSANILALHGDMIPPDAVATTAGLTGMAAAVGGAIFAYATGVVVDCFGYAPMFWAVGLASLLACLPLFALVSRTDDAPREGYLNSRG